MGNESCVECAGVGQVITELKCNSCKGNGKFLSKMDCNKCKATGTIKKEYYSQSASHIKFCDACGGNSSVDDPCSVCGGTGRMEKSEKKFRELKCDKCNGRGKTDVCDDCIGRGTIEQKINCHKCEAKANIKKPNSNYIITILYIVYRIRIFWHCFFDNQFVFC
eukprot:395336_1